MEGEKTRNRHFRHTRSNSVRTKVPKEWIQTGERKKIDEANGCSQWCVAIIERDGGKGSRGHSITTP